MLICIIQCATKLQIYRLYQESQAKDNCGFGLIVNRHGEQNREVVKRSIAGLTSMTHRGAIGADGKTGDGCGLLFDLNQKLFP